MQNVYGFESCRVLRIFLCPMLMVTFNLLEECKFINKDGNLKLQGVSKMQSSQRLLATYVLISSCI